jgi:uncharacterized protein
MAIDSRTLVWTGQEDWFDGWHAEIARVELSEAGLRATGTQLGAKPIPYRLTYRLDASGEAFVTRSLYVETVGEGWERRLRLERDSDGDWAAEVGGDGEAELPAPGGDTAAFDGALDCDLLYSPLTNVMPIRRHGLHAGPGSQEFLMAWVSVPDLAVIASRQRYVHLGREGQVASVRFDSFEGEEVVFTADLELDSDGLVVLYPEMARRVGDSGS